MIVEIITVGALLLQLVAVILALRLIRITGAKAAWSLLAAAIMLMLLRRGVASYRIMAGLPDWADHPFTEWLNLAISALMVAGLAAVSPIFAAIRKMRLALEADREALRQSEENIRLLLEGVTDYAIFRLDPQGRVASWSAGAKLINGYDTEEIVGRHVACFYPPEAVAAGTPEEELRIAAERGRYETEGWRVRKDGSRLWANVVTTIIRDGRGFAVSPKSSATSPAGTATNWPCSSTRPGCRPWCN